MLAFVLLVSRLVLRRKRAGADRRESARGTRPAAGINLAARGMN